MIVGEAATKLLLLGLLGQKYGLNVWQYTTLGNGNTREEFVKFLIVTDGQLQMSWDDSGLLVISCSISSEFENFSCEILHDCS